MSRPGRLLRAAWRDAAAETPARVAERVRRRAAATRAHAEALERFGPVTAENARAFIEWQEARLRALEVDE